MGHTALGLAVGLACFGAGVGPSAKTKATLEPRFCCWKSSSIRERSLQDLGSHGHREKGRQIVMASAVR